MPRLTVIEGGKAPDVGTSRKFMLDDLKKSGLTPEDIVVAPGEITKENDSPNYDIKYAVIEDASGSYYRTRIRREKGDPRPKYISPKGEGTHPWWPTRAWFEAWCSSPVKAIVEGEKKAASFQKHLGIPALGIPGCYGFMTGRREESFYDKNTKRSRKVVHQSELHPAIISGLRPDHIVFIVMDGDIASNEDVARAARKLAMHVTEHGAVPVIVQLPQPPDGPKVGADDWIMGQKDRDRKKLRKAFDALERVDPAMLAESPTDFKRRLKLQISTTIDKMGNVRERVLNTHDNSIKLIEELFPGQLSTDVYLGARFDGERFDDAKHDAQIARAIHTAIDNEFPMQTIREARRKIAVETRTNKVGDWLDTLKWDKRKRIDQLFTKAIPGAGNPVYRKSVARSFLVAMVARAFVPGTKYDHMTVLIGGAGILKTTFWSDLAGTFDGELLCRNVSLHSIKHLERATEESWLVNFDELAGLDRAEKAWLKQYLTQRENDREVKYVEELRRSMRASVPVGTSNDVRPMRDFDAGTVRRFNPVPADTIDIAWVRENREQLFAEAVHLYRAGYKYWEIEGADKARDDHRERSIEEEKLAEMVASKTFLVMKSGECLITATGVANRIEPDASSGKLNSIGQRVSRLIDNVYKWERVMRKAGTVDLERTKGAGISADKWLNDISPKAVFRGWKVP